MQNQINKNDYNYKLQIQRKQLNTMSWISKKIVIGRLKTLFHIDNEQNVEVSILGKLQLKCINLVLRPQVVNKPTMPIIIKYLSIGLLQTSFQSKKSSKKPLNVLVENVKLVVALNPNVQQKKQAQIVQKQKRPALEDFYKAVGQEQEYKQRSFFQEEIYQLLQLVAQYALGQLYLSIKNIDICLQYKIMDITRYFGFQIQQIQAKQQLIHKPTNELNQKPSKELHCEIKNFSAYFGGTIEQKIFVESNKKFDKIRKKYFLQHFTLNILLDINENSVAIESESLEINFQDILVWEAKMLVDCLTSELNNNIPLRPGYGPLITIKPLTSSVSKYNRQFQISRGSLLWWQYLSKKVLDRIKQRAISNIIVNKKYRKYLFCLVYRYTHGSHPELEKYINDYELFKTDMQVMNFNKQVITRIWIVRNSANENELILYNNQVWLFIVRFLGASKKNYDQFRNIKLKSLTYKDIKNSNIIINIDNCNKFIQIAQNKQTNSTIINLHMKQISVNIRRSSVYNTIHSDIQNMSPESFMRRKKKLMQFYCREAILDRDEIFRNGHSKKKGHKNGNGHNSIQNMSHAGRTNSTRPDTNMMTQEQYESEERKNYHRNHNKYNTNEKYNQQQMNSGTGAYTKNLRYNGSNNMKQSINQKKQQSIPTPSSLKQSLPAINSTYIQLKISGLTAAVSSQKDLYFLIQRMQVNDKQLDRKILKISQFKVSQENMHPEAYGYRIAAEKRMQILAQLIFIQIQGKFIEKLLTILSFINQTQTQVVQQEQKNFITKFIRQKIPNHPIFNTYQDTTKQLLIKKIIISIPVLFQNRNFQINLSGIKYDDPVNGRQSIGIEQSLISRSTVDNTLKKIQATHHRAGINPNANGNNTDEVVIMANTRSFNGFLDFQGSNPINNIVIPFILIQLSCQDFFYIKNLLNFFNNLLSNPYYFPPKKIRKRPNISQINPNTIKFAVQMKQKVKLKESTTEIIVEGIQLELLSDCFNQGNNRIMDLLIDRCRISMKEKYLTSQFRIQLSDIYIRNCISDKALNKESFILSLKDQLKYGDQPVLYTRNNKQFASQQFNTKMEKGKQLLLFADPIVYNQPNPKLFITIDMQSEVNFTEKRSVISTRIEIVPIYIFYSIQFASTIQVIKSVIKSLSAQTLSNYQNQFKNQSFGMLFNSYLQRQKQTRTNSNLQNKIQQKQSNQDAEIMIASQFEEINKIVVDVRKINLLTVKNSSVVYTISLEKFKLFHKTQPYIQKFLFYAERLIVIDTSEEAGPHPIIVDLNKNKNRKNQGVDFPFQGSFTTYKSQILMHKLKKSAFFQLYLSSPQINFLKKKVLQMVNFLMIVLTQNQILAPPDQQQSLKPKVPSTIPPLRYKIVILEPRVRLFRSSLSIEGFKAVGDSIVVTNYIMAQGQLNIPGDQSKKQETIIEELNLRNAQQSVFYQIKDQREYDEIQYNSFQKTQRKQNKVNDQTIYINIQQFHIFNVEQSQNQFHQLLDYGSYEEILSFIQVPKIKIQFLAPEMTVNIPKLGGTMNSEDFRVLMRLSEENLCQTPLLFAPVSTTQTAIKLAFRTYFNIDLTQIDLQIQQATIANKNNLIHRKIMARLQNLSGKNQLWTNNQIITQLSIKKLELVTKKKGDKIVQKLIRQNYSQFPTFSRQKAYTDISQFPKLRQIEKLAKRLARQLLQSQNQKNQNISKNRQTNPQQFANEQVAINQQQTNTQKISKWIKGMFKKCCKCKCCRKKNQSGQNQQIFQNMIQMFAQQAIQDQLIDSKLQIGDNKKKNRTATFIYRLEDMLEFQYEIDWKKVQQNKKKDNMVYMNMVIRPNGEKQLYLLAKEIQVLLENSKGLIGLSTFMAGPFVNPDIPQHVCKYKFNNNKPMKMFIEVDDVIAFIKSKNQQNKEQKLCILCDLVYDSQNRGDTQMGPGFSKMIVESVVKIMYKNEIFHDCIELSDCFKATFISQTKIPYGQKQKIKTKQKIVLKPQQRNDWNISFYVPAFILKSLTRIFLSNFSKVQAQDQKDYLRQQMMQKKKKKHLNLSVKKVNTMQQKNQMHKLKMNRFVSQGQKPLRNDVEQEIKEKTILPQKQSLTIRLVYISQITIQIQSKLKSSFIRSQVDELQYYQVFIKQKQYQRNFRVVIATVDVNYWNLKLGLFQPFVQPWKFKVQQDVYQRDNLSSSNLKISSQLDSWKGPQEYQNDLNINLTASLYQTYKELMIVYEQENYDEIQNCINLTMIDSDYDNLFRRNIRNNEDKKSPIKTENNNRSTQVPKKLKKYFTKIFRKQGQISQKYLKNTSQSYFNPPSERLFLFHSYFDHFRRRKCITFRTPYRIFNSTNVDLGLWFYNPKKNEIWRAVLKMFEYYAIPQIIYNSDFLVHISDQLNKKPDLSMPFVSVKYLIQMRAKKKTFQKINPESSIWQNIFKYSNIQTQKFVDHRDMIFRVGNYSFTAVSVYSKHDYAQQGSKQTENSKYFDGYCIIQSPIIIQNYTYLDMKVKVNGIKQTIVQVPKNQRIQINQFLQQIVSNTSIQFLNDSLHEQRKILNEKYGETQKLMQIQKMQSVKLRITRQTTSCVVIKIFTQWNISNYTNQAFNIKNSQKILLLDKYSFNCLSHLNSKGIEVSILHQKKLSKKIKQNNIADILTLGKEYSQQDSNRINLRRKQLNTSKLNKCCTGPKDIYQYIDFSLNAKEDPIYPQTQKIQIRYRYQIRNHTVSQIILCQFDELFSIATLPPYQQGKPITAFYIFYFDFIPQQYFFLIDKPQPVQKPQKNQETMNKNLFAYRKKAEQVQRKNSFQKKKIKSCNFRLDEFPGSTFVIKIKKQGALMQQDFEKRFEYLRIQIRKFNEQTIIQIMNADFKDFPIYLDNATQRQIKIVQGQDQFILRPRHRIPFAWSHLKAGQYKLEVSIQGYDSKQVYQFNNKSAFQPLKLTQKRRNKNLNVYNLYLKQNCFVNYSYLGISTVCLVILDMFDNKLRIHNKQQSINTEISMNQIERIVPLASKIQINFRDNHMIQLIPPSRTIKAWAKRLQECVNQDVIDKVFFAIQSYNNSRIFFFKAVGEEEYYSHRIQLQIKHFNVSLISSVPEEIILLYCGDIIVSQDEKQNKLNYKDLQLNQTQYVLTIKKLKINNQTKQAVNPVVLSQIKKSNYPFLQFRLTQQKLHLQKQVKQRFTTEQQLQLIQQQSKIKHFKQLTVFMDEAQLMVEAALFLKLFSIKKNFDYITNQYAVGLKMDQRDRQIVMNNKNKKSVAPVYLVDLPAQIQAQQKRTQVYINYLQIKPIKMTISVYLDHDSQQDIHMNLITIVRYIPFGIQNAIIQMDSYQFFHVFYDMKQLQKQLLNNYQKQLRNQIYRNAGSYDMFVPILLVGGVGNGVKQIFYDPIYELVKKKEIKAVGKTFCEGLLSFIAFLVGFFVKIINLAFKILAVFTFDQQFKTRRQAFRKQIFKSPVQGAVLGAKNFWKVFKSFFINFTKIGVKYGRFSIFGYFFGFLICVIQVIPWLFKLVVSLYDWVYVIGLGLVNWGYYEQSAMKIRSRPRRTFYQKQKEPLQPYNYLHSLGNQIIRKNNLSQIRNQQIYFVRSIQGRQDTNHLILSNYRIIHNYHKFTGMQEIKLYQLRDVTSWYSQKKQKYKMKLNLSIPNLQKVLFLFSYSVSDYKLNFYNMQNIIEFLEELKFLCQYLKLNVQFAQGKSLQQKMEKKDKNNIFRFMIQKGQEEKKKKLRDGYGEFRGQRDRIFQINQMQQMQQIKKDQKKRRLKRTIQSTNNPKKSPKQSPRFKNRNRLSA